MNDNYLTGSGVDTEAHIQADIEAAIVAMATFKDTEGEDLNIVPDTIWCKPSLKTKFQRIVMSAADVTGANAGVLNPYRDYGFKVVANPKVTGNTWYIGCTAGILKPFILQERKKIESVVDETFLIAKKALEYSVDWDGGAGYGLPQLACLVYNA